MGMLNVGMGQQGVTTPSHGSFHIAHGPVLASPHILSTPYVL
jgi:hypothetical protein